MMKVLCGFIFLGLLALKALAQEDTSFVYIDETDYFSILENKKAPNDPDPRQHFPFNGGKSYDFEIEDGKYDQQCRFYFANWHMVDSRPYPNFEAHKVHTDTLKKLDFKNAEWFKSHSYGDVLREFEIGDKIIYLIDSTEIKGDSTYMVRVRFYHPADE